MKTFQEYYYQNTSFEELEMLNEGFKEFINSSISKFHKVKERIKQKLEKIKDTPTMITIRKLKTLEDIKEFIKKNPLSIWLVIAAIIAGYLLTPNEAQAAIASISDIQNLAKSLPIYLSGTVKTPSIVIDTTTREFGNFVNELVKITLQGHVSPHEAINDMWTNISNVVKEFVAKNDTFKDLMDKNPSVAKEFFIDIFKNISIEVQDKLLNLNLN